MVCAVLALVFFLFFFVQDFGCLSLLNIKQQFRYINFSMTKKNYEEKLFLSSGQTMVYPYLCWVNRSHNTFLYRLDLTGFTHPGSRPYHKTKLTVKIMKWFHALLNQFINNLFLYFSKQFWPKLPCLLWPCYEWVGPCNVPIVKVFVLLGCMRIVMCSVKKCSAEKFG